MKLYHVTYQSNIESIMDVGLVHGWNTNFDYQSGEYQDPNGICLVDEEGVSFAYRMLEDGTHMMDVDREDLSTPLVVLEVDIDERIEQYPDPNTDNQVSYNYVVQGVPANCIQLAPWFDQYVWYDYNDYESLFDTLVEMYGHDPEYLEKSKKRLEINMRQDIGLIKKDYTFEYTGLDGEPAKLTIGPKTFECIGYPPTKDERLKMINEMQSKITLSLTGHRPDKLDGYKYDTPFYKELKAKLKDIIREHFDEYDVVECHSGMALGADTIWAQAIVELRGIYPSKVKFVADIPNHNHPNKWSNAAQQEWKRLVSIANEVTVSGDGSNFVGDLFARNNKLIEAADKMIAVYNGDKTGGTADTVKKTLKQNKELITISPQMIWDSVNRQAQSNDILDVKQGIIVHQVNCQNVMGSGVAKALYERYPMVKQKFHAIAQHPDYNSPEKRFGGLQMLQVTPDLYVGNSFSQLEFGNSAVTGKCYTDMDKLKANLLKAENFAKEKHLNVYVPHRIGCGLAGGNWEELEAWIQKETNIIIVGPIEQLDMVDTLKDITSGLQQ